MANDENTERDENEAAGSDLGGDEASLSTLHADDGSAGEEGVVPGDIGIERYVHVAFFLAGVFVAYVSGKTLAGVWGLLAGTPAVVRNAPWVLRLAEDERATYTMSAGGLIGVLAVLTALRNANLRKWADEVAAELYKVHWPDRETVTNGTLVVLAGGMFAIVYVGLLDRLWSFITNLVYGI
ncbi:MAG TPA: preprotein translocase subunit SecE [Polyangiaceae bacterium]|jgi:preprotein translocase subunit SecE|nr:preprotein translocase subunit SecE [Polyangiaceae bacterium]